LAGCRLGQVWRKEAPGANELARTGGKAMSAHRQLFPTTRSNEKLRSVALAVALGIVFAAALYFWSIQ